MRGILFIMIFNSVHVFSQSSEIINQLRKSRDSKVLIEIEKQVNDLIYYSPLFLGKTQYELINQSKPPELDEFLFPWNNSNWLELSEGNKEVLQGIFRATFRNAVSLSVYIPKKTMRSSEIRIWPNYWMTVEEFNEVIKKKYKIGGNGWSEPIDVYSISKNVKFDASGKIVKNTSRAVFHFTVEDNAPVLYVYLIDLDNRILHQN